jgi:hypothetical protein
MKTIVSRKVIETIDVDWSTLAKEVESKVMAKLEQDIKAWPEDLDMRAMFMRDAAEGLDVCVSLEKGNWNEVENKMWRMDTAPREYIYEFITDIAGEDFFNLMRNRD